jgi:uncharacterized protein (DUF1800 family)
METNAAIAFNRFGLGRRRGQPVPSDPRAALLSQLSAPDSASSAGLPSTADAMQLLLNLNRAKAAAKQAGADPRDTPEAQAYRAHINAETAAFLAQAITTPDGFRERLVWFWFNHFTVAARNVVASGAIGPYIREAIRPHVTGSFQDMLLAVMRHPAMLAYLDQQTSVGPDSMIGQRRNRGLNENLARECLELHTVTTAAGYTQQDVTAFARILTGWTWDRSGPPFAFMFQPNAHEPCEQVVLGRTWPDGEQGGVLLLDYLANHPATHHHLADKLVRHFVADDPPPADVARIEQVLRDTKGNLGAAAAAVVMLPGAWSPSAPSRPRSRMCPACCTVSASRCSTRLFRSAGRTARWIGPIRKPSYSASISPTSSPAA